MQDCKQMITNVILLQIQWVDCVPYVNTHKYNFPIIIIRISLMCFCFLKQRISTALELKAIWYLFHYVFYAFDLNIVFSLQHQNRLSYLSSLSLLLLSIIDSYNFSIQRPNVLMIFLLWRNALKRSVLESVVPDKETSRYCLCPGALI